MSSLRFPRLNQRQARNFWSKVRTAQPGECWAWLGSISHGYGRFRVGTLRAGAHRVAYQESTGAILSPGLVLRHSCDNRACVNPAHLKEGTQRENMLDRSVSGRHGLAKLTEGDVRAIRNLLASGSTQVEVAKRYRITQGSVANINNGRTWSWLGGGRPTHAGDARRKLSAEQVREIRARLVAGEAPASVAPDYGVDRCTILGIRSGRVYRWVA